MSDWQRASRSAQTPAFAWARWRLCAITRAASAAQFQVDLIATRILSCFNANGPCAQHDRLGRADRLVADPTQRRSRRAAPQSVCAPFTSRRWRGNLLISLGTPGGTRPRDYALQRSGKFVGGRRWRVQNPCGPKPFGCSRSRLRRAIRTASSLICSWRARWPCRSRRTRSRSRSSSPRTNFRRARPHSSSSRYRVHAPPKKTTRRPSAIALVPVEHANAAGQPVFPPILRDTRR